MSTYINAYFLRVFKRYFKCRFSDVGHMITGQHKCTRRLNLQVTDSSAPWCVHINDGSINGITIRWAIGVQASGVVRSVRFIGWRWAIGVQAPGVVRSVRFIGWRWAIGVQAPGVVRSVRFIGWWWAIG